jgi:hypothetical protein
MNPAMKGSAAEVVEVLSHGRQPSDHAYKGRVEMFLLLPWRRLTG